ncbi:hypothetical protein [Roseomonas sp. BN140053]|uniref:hypothetical protein n=1 Tax=Roseomonas sp. BN140053 TaxID=3391898 RepID=UPI0039EA15CB
MQGSTILFSEMTPPPSREDVFHRWYDEEHIPLRVAVPGFRSAQRYAATEAPGFLAVYEMDTPAVLRSPEYGAVKGQPSALTRDMLGSVSGFTRYIGEEIAVRRRADGPEGGPAAALDAPLLYAVWFTVPAERCDDFDAWYEQDHVPLLMSSPDWWMVRRFRIIDGEPGRFNRMALHYLGDEAAMRSPARDAARATPWRARLAAEPWFQGEYSLFRRHGARQRAGR